MSKPYFVKLIPVEGEIKEGVFASYLEEVHGKKTGKRIGTTIKSQYYDQFLKDCNNRGLDLRVSKLFLCGGEIGVGDTYYHIREQVWEVCDSEIMLEQIKEQEEKHGSFRIRVIGAISPNAIWVKEGDRFEENEIHKAIWSLPDSWTDEKEVVPVHDKSFYKRYDTVKEEWGIQPFENRLIMVLCSNCKVFH
jgi:hypothetical protein